MKKPIYRKWKNSFSTTHIERKEYAGVRYLEGYYVDKLGNAVRIYAEDRRNNRPATLSLDFNCNGYRYWLSQTRPLTTDRGYALISAKFICDVISGKIDPLVTSKW